MNKEELEELKEIVACKKLELEIKEAERYITKEEKRLSERKPAVIEKLAPAKPKKKSPKKKSKYNWEEKTKAITKAIELGTKLTRPEWIKSMKMDRASCGSKVKLTKLIKSIDPNAIININGRPPRGKNKPTNVINLPKPLSGLPVDNNKVFINMLIDMVKGKRHVMIYTTEGRELGVNSAMSWNNVLWDFDLNIEQFERYLGVARGFFVVDKSHVIWKIKKRLTQ